VGALEVSVGEVSVGEVSVGEVSVGEVSVGEVSVGEVSVGEVGAGEVGIFEVGEGSRTLLGPPLGRGTQDLVATFAPEVPEVAKMESQRPLWQRRNRVPTATSPTARKSRCLGGPGGECAS
jgi:hypothetical protein